MANNFRNPWLLDTVSASNPTKSGITWLLGVTFKDYTAASHKCIIKDASGRQVVELWGAADLSPVSIDLPEAFPVRDLRLDTLDSGKAVVYVR